MDRSLDRAQELAADRTDEVTFVLAEAFEDYPVMRFVLGAKEASYREQLFRLVNFFVMSRALRGELMLGVFKDQEMAAAALVSRSDSGPMPVQLAEVRKRVWEELGSDALGRYQAFSAACQRTAIASPHLHVNMIGVRRVWRGQGLARPLLEYVHALSARDEHSAGVSLTTEDSENVPLYEHFGYRVIGQATVSPALQTWTLFRSNDQ